MPFSQGSILKSKSISAAMLHILQLSAVFIQVNVPKDKSNEPMESVTQNTNWSN